MLQPNVCRSDLPRGALELPPVLRGRYTLPFEIAVGRLSASGGGTAAGDGPRGTRVEAAVFFDLSRGHLAKVSSGVPDWLVRLVVSICAPTIWTHALEAAAGGSGGGDGSTVIADGAALAQARAGKQQPGLAAYGLTLRERMRADRTGVFGRVAKWTGQAMPWSAAARGGDGPLRARWGRALRREDVTGT